MPKGFMDVVVVEAQMDETEQSIADKISGEIGANVHIRMLDDEQMKWVLMQGYGAPLISSQVIDDQLRHFTFVEVPLMTLEYAGKTQEDPGKQSPENLPRNFNERLFSYFYFWENGFSIHRIAISHTPGTIIPLFWEDPHIAIPSPPPKVS